MTYRAELADPPSRVSGVLAHNRLGVASVVFFIAAAAAPLTTAAGGAVAGFAVTGVLGLPLAYLVITVTLAVFAVGYVAMSRHITNAGAFYTYVSKGLGRMPGVGASFVAVLAYNAMQIGLYGLFGTALSDLLTTLFAVSVPWWGCAIAGWAVIGAVGVLRVDVNGGVLAVLLVAECVIVLIYDAVFLDHPAGVEISFASVEPANLLTAGWGASLAVAIAGFVGFEGSAVFAEETKDPRRTVARATFIAIAFIGVLYTVSSWALSVVVGPDRIVAEAQAGPGLVFGLAEGYLGRTFADLGQVLFVTSLFAALLSFHNTVARYLFSLGREEVLPAWLGTTHYRTGSPCAGSLTQSALAIAVLVVIAVSGLDPLVTLFFAGTSIGALGVLILMTVTSFAVIGYFAERPSGESAWSRVVAPVLAGVLLLVVLVVVLVNFHTLLGVAPDDPRSWLLPSTYAVVAGAGLAWGWYLLRYRPRIFETIGLGPNRVTGRAVSEFDSQHGAGVNPVGDPADPVPADPVPAAAVPAGEPTMAESAWGGRAVSPARTEIEIHRVLSPADVEPVANVLATAFHPDAPGQWLIPDPRERAMIYPAWFRILVMHALYGAGEVYTTAGREAVALWFPAPSGVPHASPVDHDRQLAAVTGPYLPRFHVFERVMRAEHPTDKPHHYLAFLGVLPAHQGRGIGSALLAGRLTDLHRRGIPAYLAATNRRNLALYLHHGFTVMGTIRVPDGGPTMYPMWREARAL